MDTLSHRMTDLFALLGLPSEPEDIADFITHHRPLHERVPLADAPFWNEHQAALLKDMAREDRDWAMLIDSLDVQLRAPDGPPPAKRHESAAPASEPGAGRQRLTPRPRRWRARGVPVRFDAVLQIAQVRAAASRLHK